MSTFRITYSDGTSMTITSTSMETALQRAKLHGKEIISIKRL